HRDHLYSLSPLKPSIIPPEALYTQDYHIYYEVHEDPLLNHRTPSPHIQRNKSIYTDRNAPRYAWVHCARHWHKIDNIHIYASHSVYFLPTPARNSRLPYLPESPRRRHPEEFLQYLSS